MVWKELLCLKYLTSTLNVHPDFELFQVTTSGKTFFRMKLIFKIRYFLRIKLRYLTSDFQSCRAFPQVPIDFYWSYKGVWRKTCRLYLFPCQQPQKRVISDTD